MGFNLGPFLNHRMWLKQGACRGMVGDEASTGWGLDQKRPALALVLIFTAMIQTLL